MDEVQAEVQAFIARNKHQFGYIMGEAARQWAAIDPVGALTVGPCVKQVEVYGEYWHLVDENKRLKNIVHTIANIDTMFLLPDGNEREWNDKEALEAIQRLVMPVWNEHCEKKCEPI